jgi:hypothetical protein
MQGPSPFLLALARAYLLAPAGSAHDVDLERMFGEECEAQGFRQAEILSLPEFVDLEPEERS